MIFLDNIYIAILGLVLGSFFNVVGMRVVAGQSIITPPSHCTSCGRRLTIRDLVPVFSWLFLKGRCRTCGAKLSPLYPIIEAATGLLFLFSFLHATSIAEILDGWLLVSLLMIVTVTDIEAMVVPNKIILFFFILSIVFRIIFPTAPWWDAALGAGTGFSLLFLIAILSNGGMGGGDVKLFAVLGLLVGFKLVLIGFFFATFYGALLGGLARLFGKVKKRQPVPFVPFITLGMLTAFFFGDWLFRAYLSLFS
ncbi:prepilin peptidase [Sporolactobacillus spathodeae]|uniref:Leader peptidase (Prepilin peptidase)/N-methyltransferase n=1 Tax=Sporolactobacillus spathodeae TaxID=1465502 RepID=A0ABS2Q7Y0_9BACL|nr:A24 family peptidase [Sporolactobacillus spathodeae]MBM7657410.1 leader peptidase (prepilin peptidase)/N-methyltransferase [Sporolactobacillus spathodeae]